MNKDYQVAIYTRFNVPIRFEGIKNQANIHMNKQWLDERVVLFNKFCLPSVKGQTEKNFIWFICFAENTPPEYVNQICLIDQIIPIFAGSQTQAVERSRAYLLEQGLVVTTRLDSDDSLSFNYLEELFKQIESIDKNITKDGCVLSFTNGCEYDLRKQKYYKRLYPHSPFIAFCEIIKSGKKLKGIFHEAHFCMHEKYKTFLISTEKPMWCINIHDGNVVNTIKGDSTEELLDHLFSLSL